MNAYNTKTTTRQSANNTKEAKSAKHITATSLARRSQKAKSLEISPVFVLKKIREPIKINQNATVTGSRDKPCAGGDLNSY